MVLTFVYTDAKPCDDFKMKMYTNDWVDVHTKFDNGSRFVVTGTHADSRNYVVQCCEESFSNIAVVKPEGNRLLQKPVLKIKGFLLGGLF